MLKRHEVEILLKAGHRKTEVARLNGQRMTVSWLKSFLPALRKRA